MARCKQLFEQVERGITPATVLFPWFPSPSMVRRARATKQLYDIIVKAMTVRKQTGVPRNDTLQILLDAGDELSTVVGVCMFTFYASALFTLISAIQFMMGFVTAGARATGTACECDTGHVMPSRSRKKLTLYYQLPGCSYTLVVIQNGATKHAQKSSDYARHAPWRP